MTTQTKNLTWADLKKAVNEIPEEFLSANVTLWPSDDEGGYSMVEIIELEEDYVFDGGNGCAPLSIMKNSVSAEEWEESKDEYHVVHPKGTRILIVDCFV